MTHKLLASGTLGSTASYIDIDVSSYSGYKHLELHTYALFPSTGVGGTKIYFNSDTASDTNYACCYTESNNGSIAGATIGGLYINYTPNHSSSNIPSATTYINNFNVSGVKKPVMSRFGASNMIGMYTGAWNDTSAITSIRLSSWTQSFAAGYSYSLYGLV